MDVRVGDILLMKKKHPCGGEEFPVPRPNAISKKSPTRRSSSGALCH